MRRNDLIGKTLVPECLRHPDTPISVSSPDDFLRLSPKGGCDVHCVHRLPCGHACGQKCHLEDLHGAGPCLEPCLIPRVGCIHSCPSPCGAPCPVKCMVNIFQEDPVLKCSHPSPKLPCWQYQDEMSGRCQVLTEKLVPDCSHTVTVECHVDVTTVQYQCLVSCGQPIPCGHICKKQCSDCITRNADGNIQVDHGICQEPCGRNYTTCAHSCPAPCHGAQDCRPCHARCEVACRHSKCRRLCHEACMPCEEKCLSVCLHSVCIMPCSAPCVHVPCSRRCEQVLDCGHQCPSLCGELCPSSIYCQECGSDDVKNHAADVFLGLPYRDVNLNENPCIFPGCGHFLTMKSMDRSMEIKKFYTVDKDDKPIGLHAPLQPFSIEDGVMTCAICHGPLRDITRYGRLVSRMQLDESTKKLNLYHNRGYSTLSEELSRHVQRLRQARAPRPVQWEGSRQIYGARDKILSAMVKIMQKLNPGRWEKLLDFRQRITEYRRRVKSAEQRFQLVRNMVLTEQRRQQTPGYFRVTVHDEILQTNATLQAEAIEIRLDITFIADLLSPAHLLQMGDMKLELDLQKPRDECFVLARTAERSGRLHQQVESQIFIAQLHALQRPYTSPPNAQRCLELGKQAIAKARSVCEAHPAQTSGFASEVDGAERMLTGATVYGEITSEERMVVIRAMAREFQRTWQ